MVVEASKFATAGMISATSLRIWERGQTASLLRGSTTMEIILHRIADGRHTLSNGSIRPAELLLGNK